MNGQQIQDIMGPISSSFLGVFARDQVPSRHLLPGECYIFNTDVAAKEGQHWIAVYAKDADVVEHFDPLGAPPEEADYLRQGFKRVVFLTFPVQHPLAITCGLHCIYFLVQRMQKVTLKTLVHQMYTCNLLYNECFLLSRFLCEDASSE